MRISEECWNFQRERTAKRGNPNPWYWFLEFRSVPARTYQSAHHDSASRERQERRPRPFRSERVRLRCRPPPVGCCCCCCYTGKRSCPAVPSAPAWPTRASASYWSRHCGSVTAPLSKKETGPGPGGSPSQTTGAQFVLAKTVGVAEILWYSS